MNTLVSHALALGIGFFLAMAAFVVLNVKKPDQVDQAEGFIRSKAKK